MILILARPSFKYSVHKTEINEFGLRKIQAKANLKQNMFVSIVQIERTFGELAAMWFVLQTVNNC
jgi:hypothetical protein